MQGFQEAVESGSGETPTVFEPASYRHEAFSLSSAISPHNIGSDELAERRKNLARIGL